MSHGLEAPKARQRVARGKRRRRAAPGSQVIRNSGPKGRQNAAMRVCLSPLRGSRVLWDGPGAACSLRFALAPGYLLPRLRRFSHLSPLRGSCAFLGWSRGGVLAALRPCPLATLCRACGASPCPWLPSAAPAALAPGYLCRACGASPWSSEHDALRQSIEIANCFQPMAGGIS
jgi:hypothetical protein